MARNYTKWNLTVTCITTSEEEQDEMHKLIHQTLRAMMVSLIKQNRRWSPAVFCTGPENKALGGP